MITLRSMITWPSGAAHTWVMGTKAERRAALALVLVASYHEARLAELAEHVAHALGGR